VILSIGTCTLNIPIFLPAAESQQGSEPF